MATVITSKKASEDFERIRGRHKEIVEGMAIQAEKVRQYQDMKRQEAHVEREHQAGILRETREANQKDREIELKKQ